MFSFPLDEFDRDAPAGKIIGDYENNPATRVKKMTPLEFTASINDECLMAGTIGKGYRAAKNGSDRP